MITGHRGQRPCEPTTEGHRCCAGHRQVNEVDNFAQLTRWGIEPRAGRRRRHVVDAGGAFPAMVCTTRGTLLFSAGAQRQRPRALQQQKHRACARLGDDGIHTYAREKDAKRSMPRRKELPAYRKAYIHKHQQHHVTMWWEWWGGGKNE